MTRNLKYFFSALLLGSIFFVGINYFQNGLNDYITAQVSKPIEDIPLVKLQKNRPPLVIDASSTISVELTASGEKQILLAQNVNTPLPIASVTKLMSAVIVTENPTIFDGSKIITISKAAAGQANTGNFGNLNWGEKYTLDKLMELMLVYSSNDAAYAVAEIPGVNNFVSMMNQKAAALGMQYTHYVNPNGLDPVGVEYAPLQQVNYSTASNIATLAEYILEYDPQIFKTASEAASIPTIEDGVSNLNLAPGYQILGDKTGFTDTAGGALVYVFQDPAGNRYINVILGAKNAKTRLVEMQKLINWIEG